MYAIFTINLSYYTVGDKIETILYILLKALPQVCTENTARGGVSRDKYSTRQSRVLYLSRDTSSSAVFFVQTSTGSALGGILYFELLLSHYRS